MAKTPTRIPPDFPIRESDELRIQASNGSPTAIGSLKYNAELGRFELGTATGVAVFPRSGVTGVGATGAQGATGPSFRGETGPSGGTQGATGITGLRGLTGVSPTGARGVTGAQGLQGATGITGVAPTGFSPTGARGANTPGATGLQGFTGPAGQGRTGLRGETGVAFNKAVVTDNYSPYSVSQWGRKVQILVKASELLAAGITAGEINSLGFRTEYIISALALNNFSIGIDHTFSTGLTDFLPAPTTNYYVPSYIIAGQGHTITQHFFDTPFNWNGVNNIIIQTCFNNTTFEATFNRAYAEQLSYSCAAYYATLSATVCINTTATATTNARPIPYVNGIPITQGTFSYGATGLQGATGAAAQGRQGDQGETGPQGITGVPGATGVTGATGVRGATGVSIVGQQGATGLPGGATGARGEVGAKGATGRQGDTGTTGLTGIQGTTGPQGPTGIIGSTGLQGDTGLFILQYGAPGVAGATGVQGATGLGSTQGITGEAGITGVSLGAAGSQGPSIDTSKLIELSVVPISDYYFSGPQPKLLHPWTSPTKLPATANALASVADCAWSPNGEFLATAGYASVAVFQRIGKTFYRLPDPPSVPSDNIQTLRWSPDGTLLTAAAYQQVKTWLRVGSSFSDSEPESAANSKSFDVMSAIDMYGAVWNRNNLIAYTRINYETNVSEVVVVPRGLLRSDQGAVSSFPEAANCPAWSPGGDFLAVPVLHENGIALYSVDAADGITKLADPVSMTSSVEDCAWHPSGSYVAFASSSAPYIAVYARSGNTFTKLSNPAVLPAGQAYGVFWSPDGKLLGCAHNLSPYVTIYSFDGSTLTRQANFNSFPSGSLLCGAWSPDHQFLALGGASGLDIYQTSGTMPETGLICMTVETSNDGY